MNVSTNGQHTEDGNTINYEWTWDDKLSTSSIVLSENKSMVTFNPVYSTGTAVVKGNKPLENGRHHVWEILIVTEVYGTDILVGVGTPNAEFDNADRHFCSLLGRDKESWGFSYRGFIQHNGNISRYGTSFCRGDSVGIHLDTWSGTLQFFINRKPLGVAFTRLNNVVLYPLISCTMAQCIMTLNYSCSTPANLQTACLTVLSPSQKAYLWRFSSLRHLYKNIFADILQKDIDDDSDHNIEFPAEYLILDEFDYALIGFRKKKRRTCNKCVINSQTNIIGSK